VIDYLPCARPGHRAPHVWLVRDGRRCSTLDLFGSGFTILAGAHGAHWVSAARALSEQLGVRIDAHRIGAPAEWQETAGEFGRLFGVDDTGAVLVRPDGHVAFRQMRPAAGADQKLATALRQILARAHA
jgi:hypothetical protein